MSEAPISFDPGRVAPDAAGALVAALYERHARAVYGLCRLLLRDVHEAEDAAQATFLAAHRAIVRGNEPRASGAWLFAIARNECRSRIRDRMREPASVGDAPLATLEAPGADPAERISDPAVSRALAALPERQREAVVLHDAFGLRSREVGAVLGMSLPAVEALLFRARRQLRMRLEPVVGSLALPVGLRDALASAIPGFADPAAAAGAAAAGAASAGLLAKIAAAPAAAKVAAATVAVTAAGSVAVVGTGPVPSTAPPVADVEAGDRPAKSSLLRSHGRPSESALPAVSDDDSGRGGDSPVSANADSRRGGDDRDDDGDRGGPGSGTSGSGGERPAGGDEPDGDGSPTGGASGSGGTGSTESPAGDDPEEDDGGSGGSGSGSSGSGSSGGGTSGGSISSGSGISGSGSPDDDPAEIESGEDPVETVSDGGGSDGSGSGGTGSSSGSGSGDDEPELDSSGSGSGSDDPEPDD